MDGSACGPSGDTLIGFCDGGVCVLRCDNNADCAANEICDTWEDTCVATKCGNGTIDSSAPYSETCDDHNKTDGDGCSRYCEKEAAKNSDCTAAATVVAGTQTVALAANPAAMSCEGPYGSPAMTNDFGATLRFVAPALGWGELKFAHTGTSNKDYPQVARLEGCPGAVDSCASTWGWYGPTWSRVGFDAKAAGQECWFAIRGHQAIGQVEVTFTPYSCDATPLPVGDTVMTGPESNVFVMPSFDLCEGGFFNQRLGYFIAENDGEVVLTVKTAGASLRVFEGECPSWSQKDLGCAKYSTSDTVAASVAFHVTAGQKYGVTTSNTSSSATDITVNRTGP